MKAVPPVEMPESMCMLRAGAGERFGIDTRRVRAVLSCKRPQRVPVAPAFVAGMMPYRGDVLIVADLAAMLGASLRPTAATVIVIDDDTGGECFGLLVDDVEDVAPVDPAAFREMPATVDARRAAMMLGVFAAESSLIGWLRSKSLRPEVWQEHRFEEEETKCAH